MRHTQDIVLARLRELGRQWRTGGRPTADPSDSDPSGDPQTVLSPRPSPDAQGTVTGGPDSERLATPWGRVGCLLVAIALVLATTAAFLAWPCPVDRPQEGPVIDREATGARSPGAGEEATGWPSGDPFAAPATPSPATIVVHVAGEVRHPGVVRLPGGSRVVDAVEAAGGLRRGGSIGGVNLARVLTDGERVEVGAEVDAVAQGPTGPAGAPAAGSQVDLNTATAEQLDALPGIGPVTAAKILAWRSQHGRFTVVDELAEVSGIGPKTLEELRPHVRV